MLLLVLSLLVAVDLGLSCSLGELHNDSATLALEVTEASSYRINGWSKCYENFAVAALDIAKFTSTFISCSEGVQHSLPGAGD